ncbi:hypothetical protein FAVG1_02454 [Fusarium avenaceum]|nr:hypothetical protein FAVG1_02454 [Fusarium avenaceum]
MPTLALAGGTSPSLGRAIFTAILDDTGLSQWDVVILSRSDRIPAWLRAVDEEARRYSVYVVDYLSIDSLVTALNGVDTVVSVTSAFDGTQAQIQINLLHAAVKAGCRRYAPSQWGYGFKAREEIGLLRHEFHGVLEECIKHKDRIEFANFNQGSFMNYIGHGIFPMPEPVLDEASNLKQLREGRGYKRGEDAACQGLQRQGPLSDTSGAFLIGMRNGIAELPLRDDGKWPRITFTAMRDVGRFVAAALDLQKWETEMSMVGETLTMGELLAHAEDVAQRKMQVKVLKREDLEKKLASTPQDDFMGLMWTEFHLAYIRDQDDEAVLQPVLNRLCPQVKPTGVREYMEKHWNEDS